MNVRCLKSWSALAAWATLGATLGMNQSLVAQQPSAAIEQGMEVLTRGPLHEAFAETITFNPAPGIVAPKTPPGAIEEIAPAQRPEGANVAWIPGYWSWDDERNDFLWVSGIWRALPPGRQWAAGYWGQSPQGYQWTSGYWADAAITAIDYLPKPPATIEVGPNIAAPGADSIWLPGSWIWQQNRYAWRAGYWAKGNQNWDWAPAHYVWTPSGYVFVDGYYDYSVARRGVVFAPVYFNGGLRTRRDFTYSPATVINTSALLSHLFLRPTYGHYYFGDYYGSNYAQAGFSPSFSFQSSRRGYDPIYANQRWQNRNDRGWEQRTEANYRNLRDNENARPPRNWAAQAALAGQASPVLGTNPIVAAPLAEVVQRRDGQLRFQPVNPAEREQFGQRGQDHRKYLQQRQQVEAAAGVTPGAAATGAAAPARRTFSRSPYVGAPADQLGRDLAPPQRHEVLNPDLQAQPQPIVRGAASSLRPGYRPPTAGAATGQIQGSPQAQPQRQDLNAGNRQAAPVPVPQVQTETRGENRQGPSPSQQPSAPLSEQGAEPQRPSQIAPVGQEQRGPQNKPGGRGR